MWQEINNKLVKTFTFRDFDEAWAFMTKVAALVKELDHHPTWTNEYNIVKFELYTHSAGKITDQDRQLAVAIDKLLDK
jgi:4a-hydroxytetrahydrobiopterin dehydratase